MHIARFGERLPRLQIQFRISRSFRPRNLANLGSKIRFWIRRKEHTPNEPMNPCTEWIKNPDLDLPKGTRNPFLDLKSVFGFTERNTP